MPAPEHPPDRLTVCPTEDGSFTFTSELFSESFHSTCGAKTEALLKFIVPSGIVAKASRQQEVHLLDVCFGLSYNTSSALDSLADFPHVAIEAIGLENNIQVLETAIQSNFLNIWSDRTQSLISRLCFDGSLNGDVDGSFDGQVSDPNSLNSNRDRQVRDGSISIDLRIGDARQTIAQVPDQWADAIFFDPFSPRRCPQLWTLDFCQLVANKLKPDGYWITYSCSAAVRATWQSLGLHLWAVEPLGRKAPGTIASWLSEPVPDCTRPLTPQELDILTTRAGIPYRDPSLQGTSSEIIQRRTQEQQKSQRVSSSQWLKRNLRMIFESDP